MEEHGEKTATVRRIGKTRRVIGDVLIVLVVAFMLYLGAIMHQRIQTVVLSDLYKKVLLNEQLLCLVLLVFALDVRFAFFTRSRLVPLKIVGWVLRIIVIAAAALILFIGGRVIVTGATVGAGTAEHVIVLGMALEDGQPTKDLLYRIDTAQSYGEEHPEVVLILTGGNPGADGRTEAAVMRDILVENGFPEDRLILEDQASNTVQNFMNTAKLIDPAEPVMLVSSNYHMGRAIKTAESAGVTQVIRLPAPSSLVPYGANVMWEVMMEINSFTRIILR